MKFRGRIRQRIGGVRHRVRDHDRRLAHRRRSSDVLPRSWVHVAVRLSSTEDFAIGVCMTSVSRGYRLGRARAAGGCETAAVVRGAFSRFLSEEFSRFARGRAHRTHGPGGRSGGRSGRHRTPTSILLFVAVVRGVMPCADTVHHAIPSHWQAAHERARDAEEVIRPRGDREGRLVLALDQEGRPRLIRSHPDHVPREGRQPQGAYAGVCSCNRSRASAQTRPTRATSPRSSITRCAAPTPR